MGNVRLGLAAGSRLWRTTPPRLLRRTRRLQAESLVVVSASKPKGAPSAQKICCFPLLYKDRQKERPTASWTSDAFDPQSWTLPAKPSLFVFLRRAQGQMRKRRVERAATPNSFPPPPAPTTTDNKSNLQRGRSGRLRSTLLFRPTPQQQSLPLVQDGRFPLAPSSFSTTRACLARLPPCSSSSAVCPPLPLLTFSLPPIVLLGRCAPPRLLARSLPVLTVPLLPRMSCFLLLLAVPARSGGVLSSAHPTDPTLCPPL